MRVVWFCFALVFLQPAFADDPIPVNDGAYCRHLSELYRRMAISRDSGNDVLKSLHYLNRAYQEEMFVLEEYPQRSNIIEVVYSNPNVTPDDFAKEVLKQCFDKFGIEEA